MDSTPIIWKCVYCGHPVLRLSDSAPFVSADGTRLMMHSKCYRKYAKTLRRKHRR